MHEQETWTQATAPAGLGEATALLDANQTAKAAALLQELRDTYPWMPEAPYLQSKALKKLGHDEEAKQRSAPPRTY